MEKRVIEISWSTLWRIFIFLIFAVILLVARNILLGLFMALVISSGLDAVVELLERKKVPRSLGVILIFLLAIAAVAVLVSFVIPFLLADLHNLFSNSDQILGSLFGPLGADSAVASLAAALTKIGNDFVSGGASPVAFFSSLVGGLGLAVAVLVTSFYLTLSRDGVERFIRTVFPDDTGVKALRIYVRARRKIGFWFQSQIFLSLIMSVLVWATLLFIGVKHAFVLGILAGIFELVPFVGPVISGALAVLVALAVSPTLGLYTLIAFLILHQLESHLLVPLLMRKTVDLHPVIIIMSLLIGIEVGGMLGALVAVPLAAVVQEILAERN